MICGNKIKSITLPNTIKTIGWWAFMECSILTHIDLPESVETISDGAFAMCSALKEITVPSKVKKINWYSFGFCSSLEKVTLWDGVTSVKQGAFAGSSGIKTIILLTSQPPVLAEDAFDESLKGIDIFAMCNKKNVYDNSDWKFLKNIQEDCSLSGIAAIDCNNSVQTYPNPAKEYITLDLQGGNQSINANAEIINSCGQTVYNTKITNNITKISINGLKKGVYFIRTGNKNHKFIKN